MRPIGTLHRNHELIILRSNGKTDKRALRELAHGKIVAERHPVVDEKMVIKSEFYSQALYEGKALAKIIPQLAVPPPVYQPDSLPFPSEKISSAISEHVRSSSSSETDVDTPEEKACIWDGYKDDVLPDKTHGRVLRNVRHQVFSLYRRLFGVVFIVNMAILISIFSRGGANAQELGLIVVSNIFCAVLMRQDYVINAFFTICCAVPSRHVYMFALAHLSCSHSDHSWPLAIRRICARVYHIGGRKFAVRM